MANLRARRLRHEMTPAELRLWSRLRRKRLENYRFRRQHPIGRYVVDFFCASAKLIVELDGGQHGEEENLYRDHERTLWLEARGYRVIRFWNSHVMRDPGDVADVILRLLRDPPSGASRHLPPQGGKE
jgi:very-short-patch-repair endonuclease